MMMKFTTQQLVPMSNAVRAGALFAIKSAMSGHVGIVMDMSNVITAIYANHLRLNGTHYDRFILSAGHGSAMLYSVLSLRGFDIPSLNTFRKLNGLPGHPEYGINGVDATTGPLGTGIAMAVGMAMANKDDNVYCICSDGDLMEGVANEAIAYAGRAGISNIILIWDDNGLSIDGTALTDVNIPMRMTAAGWNVLNADVNNFDEIDGALENAKKSDVPTFIRCKSILGNGTSVSNTAAAHGLAISADELETLIQKNKSDIGRELWQSMNAPIVKKTEYKNIIPVDFADKIGEISTRKLSGEYLKHYTESCFMGTADLSESTQLPNAINFGVREFAMGMIANGLGLSGVRPIVSTFLAFSDFMRPALRMAAMMNLPIIFVFSHDSIMVGEDGPTHQPIEQIASLRLIPNLYVFRPTNALEIKFAYDFAFKNNVPTVVILSRQNFEQINAPKDTDLNNGAYIIYESKRAKTTLIATGGDVPLAVNVAKKIGANVVSMPCVELFRKTSNEFKNKILRGRVVAIESGATYGWYEFADAVVGINTFGMSGNGGEVYKHFGFDSDAIVKELGK